MPENQKPKCPVCGNETMEDCGIALPCARCEGQAVDENKYRREYYRKFGMDPEEFSR